MSPGTIFGIFLILQ